MKFEIKKLFGISIKEIGWKLSILVLTSFLASIIEMFGVSLVIPLFELISNENETRSKFSVIISNFFDFFNLSVNYFTILTFIIISFFLKAIFTFVTEFIQTRIVAHINRNIQLNLVDLIEKSKLQNVLSQETGKFLNLLSRESSRFSNAIKNVANLIVHLISVSIFFLTIVLIYPFEVSVITLLCLSMSFLFLKLLKLTRSYSIKTTDFYSESQSYLVEFINNYIYLKSTNSIAKFKNFISPRLRELARLTVKSGIIASLFSVIKEPIGVLVIVFIIYFNVIQNGQPIQEIMVFALIFYRVIQKLIEIFNLWNRLNMDIGGVFEVEKNIRSLKKYTEKNFGNIKFELKNPIAFKNVSFFYSKKKNY